MCSDERIEKREEKKKIKQTTLGDAEGASFAGRRVSSPPVPPTHLIRLLQAKNKAGTCVESLLARGVNYSRRREKGKCKRWSFGSLRRGEEHAGARSWQVQEGRDPEGAGVLPWGTCRFMPPTPWPPTSESSGPVCPLVALGYGEGEGTGRGVAEAMSRPPSGASFGVGKRTFQRCYPLLH